MMRRIEDRFMKNKYWGMANEGKDRVADRKVNSRKHW